MNPFVTAILILIGVSIFGFIITGRASALAHMKFVNRFDRPFERLDDYITQDELRALSDNYKRIAGFAVPAGAVKPSPA